MTKHTCSVEDCDRTDRMVRGWCGKHYQRWLRHGNPLTMLTQRGQTPKPDRMGYVRIWRNGKTELEHRFVMEQMLARPLEDDETVHHINGVRHDNRPENLQLRVGRHGPGVLLVCHDCGSQNVGSTPL